MGNLCGGKPKTTLDAKTPIPAVKKAPQGNAIDVKPSTPQKVEKKEEEDLKSSPKYKQYELAKAKADEEAAKRAEQAKEEAKNREAEIKTLTEAEVKNKMEYEQARLRRLWEEQEAKRKISVKENEEAEVAEKDYNKELNEQLEAEKALFNAENALYGQDEEEIEKLREIAEKEKKEAEEAQQIAQKEREEAIQAEKDRAEHEAMIKKAETEKAEQEYQLRKQQAEANNQAAEAEKDETKVYKATEKKTLTANQKKALKNKKNKMLKKIKDQIETDDVDEEGAQRIAEQWVNIADIDGDGLIDFKEFKEFVNKLDGGDDAPSEEDLQKMFEELDTDQSGQLDTQEFGKALHSILKKDENID